MNGISTILRQKSICVLSASISGRADELESIDIMVLGIVFLLKVHYVGEEEERW